MRKYIYLIGVAVATLMLGFATKPAAAADLRIGTPVQRTGPAMRTMHLPDLVIQGVRFYPQHPCRPGAPALQVDVTVQNIGKAASPAVSRAGMVQARDTVGKNWGNGHSLPALAPGQSIVVHIPVYYLQGDPGYMLGAHNFKVTVNAGKWVMESNYNNNDRMAPVTMPAGFCGLSPDITSHKGPRIGGKAVAWGGSVTLGRQNAKRIQNGMCVFDFVYQMSNDGKADTSPQFVNRLRANRKLVAVNSGLHLKAGETKTLDTEPMMPVGRYTISVSLDDGNAVAESNENNNLYRVNVNVDNSCRNPRPMMRRLRQRPRLQSSAKTNLRPIFGKPDITSRDGIEINGKHVNWGGTLDLSESDATKAAGGTCTYSFIYYDVENVGRAPAGPFTNRWYSGYQAHVEVGTQSDVKLAAGQKLRLRTQELHMPPGPNVVVLHLDYGNAVAESNENNNTLRATLNVRGSCTGR